jgi:histidinol-phosphate phosphatase family protein
VSYDVVIPTVGRESLARLLRALAAGVGPLPQQVLVVDDRPAGAEPLRLPSVGLPVQLLRGRGRGPAAARNTGWRTSGAEWVAFVDDDVVTPSDWREVLCDDVGSLPPVVAASQGRIVVPPPRDRRPTDWERNVAGLEGARWATADMAYRRSALEAAGGFDERFTRAYREDADLGLRVTGLGLAIARGERHVLHPVRPAPGVISVRLQAGNADDLLMDALHGRDWRARAGAPRGRLRRHLVVTGAALVAAGSLSARRKRAATAGAALWLAGTTDFAWRRIAPGPRTPGEVWRMLWTSVLLPPAAAFHRLRGHARLVRGSDPFRRVEGLARPAAVLLDRDGTLVEDVLYNGDPDRVRPLPGARDALDRLRAAGVDLAVVSNQSGIGRGLLSVGQVEAVNRRVEELLGPIGLWFVCPHDPTAGCDCRKPRPGLVLRAAERLGVDPAACAVIGDIGSDVEAARAAGARGVLVPTPQTLTHEVDAAPETARNLREAVERLLA